MWKKKPAEYKVVEASKYYVASKLEEMTKDGWELVSVASHVDGGLSVGTTFFMFFKRQAD